MNYKFAKFKIVAHILILLTPFSLYAFNDTISIDNTSAVVSNSLVLGEAFGTSISSYYENGTQSGTIIGAPKFNDVSGNESGKIYYKEISHTGTAISNKEFYKTSFDSTLLSSLLGAYDNFGSSVAVVGDVDGNGYADIIVGASGYDSGHLQSNNDGAIFLLKMGSNFMISSVTQLDPLDLSGSNARFGYAIANIGDLDSNGYSDIAVGAPTYNNGSGDFGRVYIMRMASGGSVLSTQIINSNTISTVNGSLTPAGNQYASNAVFQNSFFGASISTVGDISGNLVPDIAVGAPTANSGEGFVNIFTLTSGGAVQTVSKIDVTNYPLLTLSSSGNFGSALAFDDGNDQLFVSSPNEINTGVPGVYRRLSLRKTYFPSVTIIKVGVLDAKMISKSSGGFPSEVVSGAKFGTSLLMRGDVNNDGKKDLFSSDSSGVISSGGVLFSIKQSPETIISGYAYDTNGLTPLVNKRVTLLKNNIYVGGIKTDSSGAYSIRGFFSNTDILTAYIDDETENGVTVREYKNVTISNFNIIRDSVIIGDNQSQSSSYTDSVLLPFTNSSYDSGVSTTDMSDLISINTGSNTVTLSSRLNFNISKFTTYYSWVISNGAILNMPLYGDKKFITNGLYFQIMTGGTMNHRNGTVELNNNGDQELRGNQIYNILHIKPSVTARSVTLSASNTISILTSAEFSGSQTAMLTLKSSDNLHVNKAIIDPVLDTALRMKYINIIDIENSNNQNSGLILYGPTGFNLISNSIGFLLENDADGVSNAIEDAGFNGGDGNNDGIFDRDQVNVTSFPSPFLSGGAGYTTLFINDSNIEINNLKVIPESIASPDPSANFPVGLYDYVLSCGSVCTSVPVVIYLDSVYDTVNWKLTKFNSITGAYADVTSMTGATFTNDLIGGLGRTKISYSITDNGPLDDDPAVGIIRDPIGPSIILNIISNNVSLSQGSSGGGGGGSTKSLTLLRGAKEQLQNIFPKFESALGEDAMILLQTNKQLALKTVPLVSDFTIDAKTQKYSVVAVTIFRDQILLLLNNPISAQDVVYVSYKKGKNLFYTVDNTSLPSVKNIIVTNVTDPLFGAGFSNQEFVCGPKFLKDINFVSYNKNDMVDVQNFLANQKFLKVKVNGVYGPSTKKAIDDFQIIYRKIILDPQGFKKPNSLWGPLTRAAANALHCGQVLKK